MTQTKRPKGSAALDALLSKASRDGVRKRLHYFLESPLLLTRAQRDALHEVVERGGESLDQLLETDVDDLVSGPDASTGKEKPSSRS